MFSRSRLLVAICVLGLLSVVVPALATTSAGTITDASTFESCFASSDGTCSATAAAAPEGIFSGSVALNSPDSPLSRAARYSLALSRYTIGFDLALPTREAEITVTLHLDDASASWVQDLPDTFGGVEDPASGAKVLLQLFGDEAPCGCGWPTQAAPSVVVVDAPVAGEGDSVSDTEVQLTMTGRNPFGDNLLPPGHYEVTLRAYALADLRGAGDWGTLTAALSGRVEDVTVSSIPSPTNLALSVAGNGANRALTAVLTDSGGAGIDGATISFFGEGELLGTAETTDGVATLPVEGRFRGGNRSFTAEFAGDETYGPAGASAGS